MATLIGTLTTAGGGDFFGDGDAAGTRYQALGSGNVDTLSIAITTSGFTGLRLAIYTDTASAPDVLLGTSSVITATATGTQSASITPVAVVSGTFYWLFLLSTGGAVNLDTVAASGYRGESLGAGVTTLPNPWNPAGDFTDTRGIPILGESTGGGGGGDATVTAVVADALGDAPNPTVIASSNVTGPVADATGASPAPANRIDIEIVTGPASATGDAPNPTVSAGTNSTVSPPVADGTGAAPVPSVQAGATPAPPVADATGTAPAPTVSGSQAGQVSPPAADGTGAAPAPVIHAGQTVSAPVADALGGAPAPTGVGEPVTHFPGAPIGFQNAIVFPEPVDTRIAAFHPVDTVLAAAYVPDTELAPA